MCQAKHSNANGMEKQRKSQRNKKIEKKSRYANPSSTNSMCLNCFFRTVQFDAQMIVRMLLTLTLAQWSRLLFHDICVSVYIHFTFFTLLSLVCECVSISCFFFVLNCSGIYAVGWWLLCCCSLLQFYAKNFIEFFINF